MAFTDQMKLYPHIYHLLRNIPRGKVTTYGAIAKALGGLSPRYVGKALHENPIPIKNPCHRVVNAQGKLAVNFGGGGMDRQKELLEKEGVIVKNYSVDLKTFFWKP